jgi:transposase
MGHRKIAPATKAEAVRLVKEGGYTVPQAAKLMGVGPTALRRWVGEDLRLRASATPEVVARQQLLIEELQAALEASREECDVLKKSLPSHLAALFPRKRRSKR